MFDGWGLPADRHLCFWAGPVFHGVWRRQPKSLGGVPDQSYRQPTPGQLRGREAGGAHLLPYGAMSEQAGVVHRALGAGERGALQWWEGNLVSRRLIGQ